MADSSPSSANGAAPAEAIAGPSSPRTNGADGPSLPTSPSMDAEADPASRITALEDDLARTTEEKDALASQYRTLLGKLTGMRQSLGDKLREDAEELDRRETQINSLSTELSALSATLEHTRTELSHLSAENTSLSAQLAQVRFESSSSSSDVVALTRELRELRGEMERLRVEREEWEAEAGLERRRREEAEEEARRWERRCMEETRRAGGAEEEADRERERAGNLQDVLAEFQAGKDIEIRQATSELETQLRQVVTSLADYKVRAMEAENKLSDISSDTSRSAKLEKDLREKNAMIGKLRHEAVVTQEHLTEALRRLRRNTSETNVDRRLVNNILLQFLCTPRADAKRFEMLSLLSTILGWDDNEREKAGLQRGSGSGSAGGYAKGKRKDETPQKSKEEEETFNESFSNLFVEFLLKEAAQGQSSPRPTNHPLASPTLGGTASPPLHPPPPGGFMRNRTLSSASLNSAMSGLRSPPSGGGPGAFGRTVSFTSQAGAGGYGHGSNPSSSPTGGQGQVPGPR